MPLPVTEGQIRCSRCAVAYSPRLVGGSCPVCRTPAEGEGATPHRPADNAMLLVGAATLANLILLAVLTILLLH